MEKSGKPSCCAPDGAWFNDCGSGGDVEHTWAKGLQACKGKGQDMHNVTLALFSFATYIYETGPKVEVVLHLLI